MLLNEIKDNFDCLGFAEWVDGRGLQIPNIDTIEDGLSGVYVMVDTAGNIQKVGKSSANLKSRLKGYRSFDKGLETSIKNGKDGDASSIKQRRAIHENNLNGLYVYCKAAEVEKVDFCGFVEGVRPEFDAHDLESKLKAIAVDENQPLAFGNM